MIARFVHLQGSRALDIGCGVGAYAQRMAQAGAQVTGLEVELDRAGRARAAGLPTIAAVSEHLPFAAASFDVVLLHEVLEHVADDGLTMGEVGRVLAPEGRAVVFVPNRGWPFETHGVLWRGRYAFGNAPFVNYLPDPLRNRLAPHVRAYTRSGLRAAAHGTGLYEVVLRGVFPGFDTVAARRPALAGWLRRLGNAAEGTPLEHFGLSHLWVLEKTP